MRVAQAIEMRDISSLTPYARNARTHTAKQIRMIARSIERFGFNNPILVDGDNGVIAGHGRLAAAKELGLETVPVIELSHLTDADRRAYILADNKLAELSAWDNSLLSLEVGEITDAGVNLEEFGFGVAADLVSEKKVDLDDRTLILIECADEAQQRALFEEFQTRGIKCKIS